MVGLELAMTEEDRTTLWQAAALHDIGKAAVPDAILDKPGPLDDDEGEFMRRHTVIGERILGGAPALSAAARLVRSSHERFDGKGIPRPARRRRHTARSAHSRGLRRLRRHGHRPTVPTRDAERTSHPGAHPLRRHPIRPRRRQRLRNRTRAPDRQRAGRTSPRRTRVLRRATTSRRRVRPRAPGGSSRASLGSTSCGRRGSASRRGRGPSGPGWRRGRSPWRGRSRRA